jgi:pyruvate kinase
MRQATGLLRVAAIVTYTRSGYTSLRAARERLTAPVVCMTPEISTARRLTLAWGVHSVHAPEDIRSVDHMVEAGCAIARRNRLASTGHHVLVASGTPFGTAGTTNFLHIAKA